MRGKIAKIGELRSRGMCVVLRMASVTIFALTIALIAVTGSSETVRVSKEEPKPTPWPEQFHALLVMNHTVTKEVQVIDLWYDWPNGRNLNLIQHQLGKLLYDVEWNNGTSFFYTLARNADVEECRTRSVEVGILRPNWLDGATYLGQRYVAGFLCNVWTKADFIWYYEDVVTKKPVYWLFYTGRNAHVMTFQVGAVLEDSQWQAPVYCFDKQKQQARQSVSAVDHLGVELPLLRPEARAFL